jgi:hypothetical protein
METLHNRCHWIQTGYCVSIRAYEAKKMYIKNEGLTRDVVENNRDKNWHPVMLMKNK